MAVTRALQRGRSYAVNRLTASRSNECAEQRQTVRDNTFRLDSSTRRLIAVRPPDAAFLIQPLGVGAGRRRYLRRRPDLFRRRSKLRIRCGRATLELNWLKLLVDCKPEAVNSVGAVAPLCLVSF